jgi:hypothetical protein
MKLAQELLYIFAAKKEKKPALNFAQNTPRKNKEEKT